jgi:hypothetical protein
MAEFSLVISLARIVVSGGGGVSCSGEVLT